MSKIEVLCLRDIDISDKEEVFAELFAYNLLMPENEVRKCLLQVKGSWQLEAMTVGVKFGVPLEKAYSRLRQLGIITDHDKDKQDEIS